MLLLVGMQVVLPLAVLHAAPLLVALEGTHSALLDRNLPPRRAWNLERASQHHPGLPLPQLLAEHLRRGVDQISLLGCCATV